MKAYISWLGLMQNNTNFGAEGKLASLWFDQLLLGADERLLEKVFNHMATQEHWSSDTKNELMKIQISSQVLMPEITFVDNELLEENICETAYDIMRDSYAKDIEIQNYYSGEIHEIVRGGAAITRTVKYWMLLNAKERCTFLPLKLEREMLQKIFNTGVSEGFANFTNIMTGIIPDISEYSWNEIIELRNHHYWEQFRKKISALNSDRLDSMTAHEVFNEVVYKDLVEMAKNLRPTVKSNIVKGVISNIPLPIPFNPVSLICTGSDIIKEIDFEKRYGWLYFYIDNKK